MTAAEIAECLGMALSTVSRWLKRIGLGKRSRLEPPEPPNRYERKRPGELIHVDVKKLGRIASRRRPPGHRQSAPAVARSGRRRLGGAGLGVRPRLRRRRHPPGLRRGARRRARRDAPPASCERAVAWFSSMGITVERVMSDNGSCYRSHVHAPGLPRARAPPPAHPALPAAHQRQGRALHPDAPEPLGLRSHLRHLGRAHRGPPRLAHPLQLHPTTRLPRPQAARSSARRAGTTSWVATASRRSRRTGSSSIAIPARACQVDAAVRARGQHRPNALLHSPESRHGRR